MDVGTAQPPDHWRHLCTLACALALAACKAQYPEGAIVCDTTADCPSGWSCHENPDTRGADKRCFSEPAADSSSASRAPDGRRDAGAGERSAAGESGDPAESRAGAAGSGSTSQPAAGSGGKKPPQQDDDAGAREPEVCGDLQSDPNHCGQCGRVCSVANGAAACREGVCAVASCEQGYGDCDASPSNGCETPLDTAADCGGCGLGCETTSDALRTCEAGSCSALQLSLGPAEPAGPINGSLGGGVFTHMCPEGEALTGLELGTSESVTYGFNASCAPISLTGTWAAPRIVVGESHPLSTPVGGLDSGAVARERADCPADTVVTGASGSLIIFAGETRLFIKTVLLACSRVSRLVPSAVFVPDSLVPTVNAADPGDGRYSDSCPAGQVLTGFTGYAGAAIDALQTHCSSLNLQATSGTASSR